MPTHEKKVLSLVLNALRLELLQEPKTWQTLAMVLDLLPFMNVVKKKKKREIEPFGEDIYYLSDQSNLTSFYTRT